MQLKNLNTSLLGKEIIFLPKVDSTQSEIWRLIEKNKIASGTIVVADIQTAGKGTHGRTWYTDESGNIAFSMYIKTSCNVDALAGVTLAISMQIISVLQEKYGIRLDIKEPNDIMINDKKVGGILTEIKTIANEVKVLVIGIGINTTKMNFDGELKNIATSIKKEFDIAVVPEEFICEFCNRFEIEIKKRRIF